MSVMRVSKEDLVYFLSIKRIPNGRQGTDSRSTDPLRVFTIMLVQNIMNVGQLSYNFMSQEFQKSLSNLSKDQKLSKIIQQQLNQQRDKNGENLAQRHQQEKIRNPQTEKQKLIVASISSILWAYTFNRSLKFKTIAIITDLLLSINPSQLLNIIEPFQLINIVTFYYSLSYHAFPKSLLNQIKKLSLQSFQYLHTSMNSLELMKCLKYFMIDERQEGSNKLFLKITIWQKILDTFQSDSNQIEYEHIMGIVGIVLNSPLGRAKNKKAMSLVSKLLNRKKNLEKMKTFEEIK